MKKLIPALLAFVFLAGVFVTAVHASGGAGAEFANCTDDSDCIGSCQMISGEASGKCGPVPTNPTNPTGGSINAGAKLDNPFKTGGNLMDLFSMILSNIVVPIGAVGAVLAFIYSGFLYVMAQGDPKQISTAHNALLYTVIGTALLIGASVLAKVIENTVNSIKY